VTSGQPSQEIRLAIVLYGGVSLAVYINGVVQELLRLVRGTSGAPLPADGTDRIYRKLGSILERDRIPSPDASGDDVIRTKFIIDIVSGTSAGGINGIFLAKALANDADLAPIEQLWFDEGDIAKLLNDADSYDDLRVPPSDPVSLLNSRRMYSKLLDAFDLMDGGAVAKRQAAFTSPLTERLDLFATTTDIEGIPVPIRLFDNVVYERRHRNAFHLRFTSGQRNDFQHDNNPFLAFTARCTSSFPFAFEPMQLCSIDEILKPHPDWSDKTYCHSGSSRWQKFYTNYLHGVLPGSTRFAERSFGDGGYLNNAPFSYAVDALLERQSEVPVDRKLLYVEPSPSHVEEEAGLRRPPNAIENSVAALITIPGYQAIRNDLTRVMERNVVVSRVNKTINEIEVRVQSDAGTCDMPADGLLDEIWFQKDRCYHAYYQLRAAAVTDLLTTVVARMRGIEEDSAFFRALRAVIRAWREETYAVDPRTPARGKAPHQRLERFLRDFDLPYRMRRLRFVLRKLDTLHGLNRPEGDHARTLASATLAFGLEPDAEVGAVGDLAVVHARLARSYRLISHILRHVLERPDPEDTDTPAELRDKVTSADPARLVRDVLPERHDILKLLCLVLEVDPATLAGGTDRFAQGRVLSTQPILRGDDDPVNTEARLERQARLVLRQQPTIIATLDQIGERLTLLLAGQLIKAHADAVSDRSEEAANTIARRYYHCFDLFDSVQYPMTFGTDVGEADTVEIIRVCPEDAPTLVPEVTQRRRKLRGLVAAHFGAFLDRDWRVSDLLWGRLDTAERIISAMLPWESTVALRDRLVDEAQNEILRTFDAQKRLGEMATRQAVQGAPEARLTPQNIRDVIDAVLPVLAPPSRPDHQRFMRMWNNVVPAESSRVALMRTLARSTQIVGGILERISADKNLTTPARWITNAGRLLWGVVEISVPRSAGELLGRYWNSLALLIGMLLVALGLVSDRPGIDGVGWMLVSLAAALVAVRSVLRSFMSGTSLWRRARTVVFAVIAVVLVAGIFQSYQWGQSLLAWIDSAVR
jgi:patatin-related protein